MWSCIAPTLGNLDPLGMAEQRGIASRMRETYPQLFDDGTVTAISSYVPRCIMSMYSFTHELASINTSTYSYRPTRDASTHRSCVRLTSTRSMSTIARDGSWKPVYDSYFDSHAPANPIIRAIGSRLSYRPQAGAGTPSMTEYGLLAGLRAMSIDGHITAFSASRSSTRCGRATI